METRTSPTRCAFTKASESGISEKSSSKSAIEIGGTIGIEGPSLGSEASVAPPQATSVSVSNEASRMSTRRATSWGFACSGHLGLEPSVQRVEEGLGREVRLVRADQDGEVLGHLAGLDDLDAHLLERVGELHDVGRVV